jgi:predicted MFS family arabinose efflux permease
MSFAAFVATRVVIGMALAAVYTTGMRAVMSWVSGRMRGFAVASLVSALTLGTALPHLAASAFVGDWRQVLVVTALAAALGAGLSCLVRSGPHVSAVGAVTLREAISVLGSGTQRRITLAYLGHMWEIYGMWVWLPSFLTAVILHGGPVDARIGSMSFLVIGVAGVGGSLVGALALRRWTGWSVSRIVLLVGGLCIMLTPILGGLPEPVAVMILAVWGAAVIADSALYSAMTGDESGRAAVGTAVALQMGLGYGLSVVAIMVVSHAADTFGWAWAFLVLLPGPLLGLLAMRKPVAAG